MVTKDLELETTNLQLLLMDDSHADLELKQCMETDTKLKAWGGIHYERTRNSLENFDLLSPLLISHNDKLNTSIPSAYISMSISIKHLFVVLNRFFRVVYC